MTLTISKEQGAWRYGSREGPSEPFKAADNGCTPLLVASEMGHTDVVRLLLVIGADVSLKTSRGTTALQVATSYGHTEVMSLLEGA